MTSSPSHPADISDALKNEFVAQLWDEIGAGTPLKFSPSTDMLWASETSSGSTTIYYAKTKRPGEALAHELLHAELKIAGYRQYIFAVAKQPCPQRTMVPKLLEIIDNELQHHRMAARFTSLGFALKHFYHDGDVHTYKKVRRALERMNSSNTTAEFFTQFVTVISPGGEGSDRERMQLKTFLMTRCPPQAADKLREIETVFGEWAISTTLEADIYIQKILHLMDVGCSYWVGASQAFPADGFFVGSSFELQEAEQ